jgi:hypothetical protein
MRRLVCDVPAFGCRDAMNCVASELAGSGPPHSSMSSSTDQHSPVARAYREQPAGSTHSRRASIVCPCTPGNRLTSDQAREPPSALSSKFG